MFNNFERIVRRIYRERKATAQPSGQSHLSDEVMACFLDDKLPEQDKNMVVKHLLGCPACAELLSVLLKIPEHLSLDVPPLLLEKINKTVGQDMAENLLEIFLRLKVGVLELIQTTGDIMLGQELVPAPVLRSRKINEFKEELSILKDLQQIRVLAKIAHKSVSSFNLTVTVMNKHTLKHDENLRVTLIKDEVELESYMNDSGSSFFENILPGDYIIEVSRLGQREAVIDLKVKV